MNKAQLASLIAKTKNGLAALEDELRPEPDRDTKNLPNDFVSEILIAADLCEQYGFNIAAEILRNRSNWEILVREVASEFITQDQEIRVWQENWQQITVAIRDIASASEQRREMNIKAFHITVYELDNATHDTIRERIEKRIQNTPWNPTGHGEPIQVQNNPITEH